MHAIYNTTRPDGGWSHKAPAVRSLIQAITKEGHAVVSVDGVTVKSIDEAVSTVCNAGSASIEFLDTRTGINNSVTLILAYPDWDMPDCGEAEDSFWAIVEDWADEAKDRSEGKE